MDSSSKSRTTMRRKRGAIGAPSIDVGKIAEAIRSPGIDTRMWVQAGTVGVRDPDGTFKTDTFATPTTGPRVPTSVFVDRLGAIVDVRLEPGGEIVSVHWSGMGVGRFGSILFPLRGGDDVLVLFCGGDMNSADKRIVAVGSNTTAQIPEDWNNDRVLFSLNVPLQIRGPSIDIRSANLKLNGRIVGSGSEGI